MGSVAGVKMHERVCEPYPSDVADAEWKVLEPLLPGPVNLGRPPRYESAVSSCDLLRGALGLFVADAVR